jgi:hypothetical protein
MAVDININADLVAGSMLHHSMQETDASDDTAGCWKKHDLISSIKVDGLTVY